MMKVNLGRLFNFLCPTAKVDESQEVTASEPEVVEIKPKKKVKPTKKVPAKKKPVSKKTKTKK